MDNIKLPSNTLPGAKPEEDELVYKTMPKGFAKPAMRPPAPPPSIAPAVAPAPAAPAPIPGSHTGVKEEPALLTVGAPTGHSNLKRAVLIVSLVIIIVLTGLGYMWYKKHQSQTPAPQQTSATAENQTSSKIDSSWIQKYFSVTSCVDQSTCGDSADPDRDGLTNLQEFNAKTDPNNADSDGDGLADGDEINIFGTDALSAHSGGNTKYSDGDDAKTG
ncbi:MAG TPA: hypothetical protein VF810_03995, partial [Patescibacteria group bacterium]